MCPKIEKREQRTCLKRGCREQRIENTCQVSGGRRSAQYLPANTLHADLQDSRRTVCCTVEREYGCRVLHADVPDSRRTVRCTVRESTDTVTNAADCTIDRESSYKQSRRTVHCAVERVRLQRAYFQDTYSRSQGAIPILGRQGSRRRLLSVVYVLSPISLQCQHTVPRGNTNTGSPRMLKTPSAICPPASHRVLGGRRCGQCSAAAPVRGPSA